MEWQIIIRYDQQYIHLLAEQIFRSEQLEKIKISGKNRSIVLQNNRPLLQAKGLKSKRIDWKLVEGDMHNSYVLQSIIHQLEKQFKSQSK